MFLEQATNGSYSFTCFKIIKKKVWLQDKQKNKNIIYVKWIPLGLNR